MILLIAMLFYLACLTALGLLVPRFLGAAAKRIWSRLSDETGAAMPSKLTVATFMAVGYFVFLVVHRIL